MLDRILNWVGIILIFAVVTMIIWGLSINEQSLKELECLKTNQCKELR